jgi:hypothetical protein
LLQQRHAELQPICPILRQFLLLSIHLECRVLFLLRLNSLLKAASLHHQPVLQQLQELVLAAVAPAPVLRLVAPAVLRLRLPAAVLAAAGAALHLAAAGSLIVGLRSSGAASD